MVLQGGSSISLLRANKYALKTTNLAISGLGRSKKVKGLAGVRKNPGLVETVPSRTIQFIGAKKAIGQVFSESGERVIAHTIAHQLENPKIVFRIDVACAVERVYRGTKVKMNGKEYVVTVTMVSAILRKMFEKRLLSEKEVKK